MAGQDSDVGARAGGDVRLDEFVADLARLRREAGQPSLRKMAETAHYSHTALSTVLSAARLPSLELTLAFVRACGGDEDVWRERWQREYALVRGDQPVDRQPGGQSAREAVPVPPRRTVSRWVLLTVAGLTALVVAAVVALASGSGPFRTRQAAGPSVSPESGGASDGADPQEEHCQVDAVSAQTTPVPDPDPAKPPYGSLTLRYSPRCRAAWPLFVSTERVPTGATIRLRTTRPADRAVSRFDYPYMVKSQVYSVFGNVLGTTRGCVSVGVEISTADNRRLLARGHTPCVDLGAGS
ncbi:DUF2690 domain-containing protein [Plantactinospora sp. KBS50]|uniref:DUF2690 domain-containing protein n=1 Tax=Plantactinospora sp. KBS50 TaxID=2024580 RepID=UPI000BAAB1F0|nr:DUF2690 domain-containing protein [Plantactinospora sp. KBS50]ASW53810.1 hypothetical protein CIK06_05850 [Plantactinospora sp. KBS50]